MVTLFRNWTPDTEYIAIRIPDKMLVASIINEIKGDRTMSQLADIYNVSASTLSRAVNRKNTKPMSLELIKRLADSTEKRDSSIFERLARANGLVPGELYGEKFNGARLERHQQLYLQRRED